MSTNRNLVGPFTVRNNTKSNFIKFPGTQNKAQFVYNDLTNKVFLVMRNPQTRQLVLKNFGKTMTQVANKPNITLMFQNNTVKQRTLKKLNNLRGLSNQTIKPTGKNALNIKKNEIINSTNQLSSNLANDYFLVQGASMNPALNNKSVSNAYQRLLKLTLSSRMANNLAQSMNMYRSMRAM
tara:strand:+ start:1699 stop:2241 length:543 start_codon:yes stop_codon:yes gene_type:complete